VQVDAKLCIDCGFHFELGEKITRGQLDSAGDNQAVVQADVPAEPPWAAFQATDRLNPYAPSAADTDDTKLAWELSDEDLPKVSKVATSAIPIWISLCLTPCICFPLPALMLPMNIYRLLQWWQLYQKFENLRKPNSLSPHVELELEFQQAFLRYVVSILLGVIWIAIFAGVQLG
jgi:hypothetical protein